MSGEPSLAATQDSAQLGLSGLRVLDLGRYIAGPYCAALLADQGAEVIRIEAPGGAPDREVMPIGIDGRGALFLQVNRNKKSVELAIDQPEGRRAFERLVSVSDVVIVNLPPSALARAGLDYESLSAIREDIILTTIGAMGFEGPDRDRVGFDGTGQALSGAMHLTGTGERPMRAAVSYVDYATGTAAAFATISALFERTRTGKGQHVQASLLGTALTMMNPMLIEEASGARTRRALGNRSPIAGPSDMFRASDGWVMVQVIGDGMFARWTKLVARPDVLEDVRFASDLDRGENGEELSAIMSGWCATRTVRQCLVELEAARLPGCPVLTPGEALGATQNVESGFLQEDPALGVPIVASSLRTSAALAFPTRSAPELGAHTEPVLRELGFSEEEIGRLNSARQPVD